MWLSGKESACLCKDTGAGDTGDAGLIPGWGISPLKEEMAMYSSILTWKIP